MSICPDCGHRNFEGAESCEICHGSLSELGPDRPQSPLEQHLVKDTIEQLAPREPLLVPPEMPVGEVLQRMAARKGGCAIITSNRQVIGIFTDRDALMRLNIDDPGWKDRPIAEVMTSPVETLEMRDPIAFAMHKMDLGGYRHLPVLNEGRIVGIVSVRDLLNYLMTSLVRIPGA